MGIQDDIFDVAATLKDTPEAEQFERLMEYFCKVESDYEDLAKEWYQVGKFVEYCKEYDFKKAKEIEDHVPREQELTLS
tara:strand:+ start:536 stop:772 length:237 start_codon:yes stop_codon:yes gene_type:complete